MFLLFCIIFIILIELSNYSTVVFIIVEYLFNCQYFFEKIFAFFPLCFSHKIKRCLNLLTPYKP